MFDKKYLTSSSVIFVNTLHLILIPQLNSNYVLLGSQNDFSDGKHDEYAGEHALTLCDNIRNYKFILAITAYYPNIPQAVYGSLFMPTCLFIAAPEYKYYATNSLSFDAIQYETDTQCRVRNSSKSPIGIYGVK